MTKRLMILLAICGLSLASLNGCTSKESKDDAEVATETPAADATASGDNLEALDGETPPLEAGNTADALPEDSLDSALSETPPVAESPASDPAAGPTADASAQAAESALDMPTESAPEPTMPEPPSSSGVADIEPPSKKESEPASYEPPPVVSNSLKKIPEKPWTENGILLNTVYFARPGDTVSSVSQMIYGSDKTAELKKANPKLKNRNPKPSEKIYYNSPQRSADSEKMITYYEDNGMTAETYIAQEGDTIQKVGKNLLGYDVAWKEIWPINAVESKGKLEAGTELKYWKSAPKVAAAPAMDPTLAQSSPPSEMPPPLSEMAANLPPPEAPPGSNELPPPPSDMSAALPPPPMDMNGAPPPPSMDQAAMNEMPPPPPPEAAAPPPPPPPPMDKKMPAVAATGESMDEETMVALGGIAVAALGLTSLLVAKRKRRQKELEAAFNETQVGT